MIKQIPIIEKMNLAIFFELLAFSVIPNANINNEKAVASLTTCSRKIAPNI
jgi:hypothetical protein